ncbi:hypothetical protein ACJZ2D_014759 [Fusarium nematophilum]
MDSSGQCHPALPGESFRKDAFGVGDSQIALTPDKMVLLELVAQQVLRARLEKESAVDPEEVEIGLLGAEDGSAGEHLAMKGPSRTWLTNELEMLVYEVKARYIEVSGHELG